MAPSARKASTGRSATRVMSSGLGKASGFAYLVRLIAEPHRECHAPDLAVWTSGGAAGSAPRSRREEELLDQQARAAYRQRIAELTEELEEAQGWATPSVPPGPGARLTPSPNSSPRRLGSAAVAGGGGAGGGGG